ncbi:MAG: NAD(P)/FAD-dependent oxidoreductase [Geobacter sp.]|nr:NAD(P)/FAD-dependent oxidoreductase [Geobacter sp.]
MSIDSDKPDDVIVIGAGPAGLAAGAHLAASGGKVSIFEKEGQVGGISKTVEFKGYRFDLGGHRFFTKSAAVNNLWNETLGSDFLTRPRLSRIYYRNKFFNYPLKPANALFGLGIPTSVGLALSYLKSRIFPYRDEETFEQWVSNRFGKKLYSVFFKTYTEKLWGMPCSEIRAEWAAQRIKGLSLTSAIRNAFFPDKSGNVKTLIDSFQYPKFGPGMMYEKMAGKIENLGGKIFLESDIVEIKHETGAIRAVIVRRNGETESEEHSASHFISSMPITDLVKRLSPSPPPEVVAAAEKLSFRSFISVSLIMNLRNAFPDTWVYVHSPEVMMGRIQNFGNWSPHMLADPARTALGVEYFCTEGDELWRMKDESLIALALEELEKVRLGSKADFLDGFVTRVPKAYPVYDADYPRNLLVIRDYLAGFSNLQPVGRYGMFKYNNMDHSILTGLQAAANALGEQHDIWSVNTDQEYLETCRA